MSSVWQQEASAYSPCVEIDSSSVRVKDGLNSPAWLKQEHDDLRIIKLEHYPMGPSADVVQDNTPSSAMSTASLNEGLPPRVLLTITKLQCMVESKQQRIIALERQVEDLIQDRQFLRNQIENLTSNRSLHAFATPNPMAEAPVSRFSMHGTVPRFIVKAPTPASTSPRLKTSVSFIATVVGVRLRDISVTTQVANSSPTSLQAVPRPSKTHSSEVKSHKRERGSSSSSGSSGSDCEGSDSSEVSAASSEQRKKKHHKDKKKSKKSKDYSRKRATGVQYVVQRYKQVLSAFNKRKNMSEAFRQLGIDRNTIANTASIAELHLANKDMIPLVGQFRQGEETLVSYAQRCTMVIDSDPDLARKIDHMKANGELLPISGKRSRLMHGHLPPLGCAADTILIG